MRRRVRRCWQEWEAIGASGTTLQWIREGVPVPFSHRPPPPFNHGTSLLDATLAQCQFLD
jgi:hypothetical protein